MAKLVGMDYIHYNDVRYLHVAVIPDSAFVCLLLSLEGEVHFGGGAVGGRGLSLTRYLCPLGSALRLQLSH